jgi:DNA relaxase NicK
MRFDAYACTLASTPEKVLSEVLENLPYSGLETGREKGKNNYEFADVVKDALGETVCMVLHGGNGGKPHLRAQGVYSPDIATIVRGIWPEHPVTRADVAVDFDGQDAFAKLHRLLDGQAARRGLKVDMAGDWRANRDPLAGRTFYLGARSSTAFLRLYEKGLQQVAKHRHSDETVSLDWTRLEIEVKPQSKDARYRAAHLAPADFWGVTTWSRDILRMAVGLDVERVNMNLKRESEDLTALKHMIGQYRQALQRESARSGETEVQLFERLLEEHDNRARAKVGPAWSPLRH